MGIQIQREFSGTIFLGSATIDAKVLEGAKALVSAFFPRATIKAGSFALVQASFGPAEEQRQLQSLIRIEKQQNQYKATWLEVRAKTLPRPEEAQGVRQSIEDPRGFEAILNEPEVKDILTLPRIGREGLDGILAKQVLSRLLSQITGEVLPWGILTGIRPTKLAHRLVDMGFPRMSLERTLSILYGILPDKVKLLQEVARVQEPYLETIKKHPQRVSIYIGIPFCPTRCSYCSFPAYRLGKRREEVSPYLEALKQEIRAVGELMRANALEGDAIYLGGGTPTILDEDELRGLIVYVKKYLPLNPQLEFSVEAGRPDTLSLEKLRLLASLGVKRISINPQTMQEETLRRIGRRHNPQSVVEMFQIARNLGDWVINMDLILGLPGEGLIEIESTLEQIKPLRPDNLTVHALALKRGARERDLGNTLVEARVAEQMEALAGQKARAWGMRPYYLYRQKRIAGNLENVGYSLPGKESRYNIAIMEERQNIIGLGAGAASKILSPTGGSLTNMQHPSDVRAYQENWHLLHARRLSGFSEHYPEAPI